MGNLRPFRRRLAVSQRTIAKRRRDRIAGRWPFGGPSLSTVRRWMRELYKAEPQNVERTVQRTGKPGRPPYAYRWIGPPSTDGRTFGDAIADERLVTILRRARGKPLTEDQILDRYKAAMDRRNAAARELAAGDVA